MSLGETYADGRTWPHLGRQVAAARVLVGIGQEELAKRAGLHVNSVRYVERQDQITTGHSAKRIAAAMYELGAVFFSRPSPGVRLRPEQEEFSA